MTCDTVSCRLLTLAVTLAAVNKPLMLQCGLLERVLQNLHVDFAAVQFKLLATLRMAVDGQGQYCHLHVHTQTSTRTNTVEYKLFV